MAKILEMPKLSPTMEEGQLSTWHKKEGDVIAIDDLLAEVETDKATMEFRSFDKGTLLKLLVPAGSMVKLGQPVAIVGQPGEDISGLVGGAGGEGGQPQGDQQGNQPAADQQASQGQQAPQQGQQGGQQGGNQQPAPPAQQPAGAASQSGTSGGYGGITPQPSAGQQSSGGSGHTSGSSGQQGQGGQQGNQGGQSNGDQQNGNQQGPQSGNQGGQPNSGRQGGQQDQGGQQGQQVGGQQGGQGNQGQQGGQGQQASGGSGQSNPSPGAERVKASPYVRKLAREHDVDLHGVQGSGPAGRVVARDVEPLLDGGAKPAQQGQQGGQPPPQDQQAQGQQQAPQQGGQQGEASPQQAAPKAAPKPAAAPGLAEPEARPLSMMRKTIARRLTEAKQTVPHFYLTIDVDAGALVELREKVNGELAQGTKKGEEPTKVSLNDFLIKACAAALRRVPECNAQFTPDAILIHRRVDISVAVAVPDGLVTPVLRDADRLGVAAISSAVRDLATRAKAKKLSPDEMQNGTFSISNLGMFGIDEFSAVINPPEGAILAVGRVRDEPVVRDGQVVAGKRLALTLSCDHRVIDGAVGARFLEALRSLIERPMQILVA